MEPSFSTLRPKSAVGGPLGLVRTGDLIRLSERERKIDLLVPPEELASRSVAQPRFSQTPARGYAALYARHVLSAAEGCDFDFLTCRNAPLEWSYPPGAIRAERLSRCHSTSAKCRRLRNCQAAATAVRHVVIATARSARCVWAEMRWRWTAEEAAASIERVRKKAARRRGSSPSRSAGMSTRDRLCGRDRP